MRWGVCGCWDVVEGRRPSPRTRSSTWVATRLTRRAGSALQPSRPFFSLHMCCHGRPPSAPRALFDQPSRGVFADFRGPRSSSSSSSFAFPGRNAPEVQAWMKTEGFTTTDQVRQPVLFNPSCHDICPLCSPHLLPCFAPWSLCRLACGFCAVPAPMSRFTSTS